MISEGLPERVQLEKVCGAGKEFRGIIPFLRLDRVKPLLADQDGAVSVEVAAWVRDNAGIAMETHQSIVPEYGVAHPRPQKTVF